MFPNDFIRKLENIWNRTWKRVEQEEKACIIYSETVGVINYTISCYASNDNANPLEATWKIKVIAEDTAHDITSLRWYISKNYDQVISTTTADNHGINAYLTTICNDAAINSKCVYFKDI